MHAALRSLHPASPATPHTEPGAVHKRMHCNLNITAPCKPGTYCHERHTSTCGAVWQGGMLEYIHGMSKNNTHGMSLIHRATCIILQLSIYPLRYPHVCESRLSKRMQALLHVRSMTA